MSTFSGTQLERKTRAGCIVEVTGRLSLTECTQIHVFIHIQAVSYICIHTHTHTHTHTYVHTYIHTYICEKNVKFTYEER